MVKGGKSLLGSKRRLATTSLDKYEVLVISETFTSKNKRKRDVQELSSVQHIATPGAWINMPITFGQQDQPKGGSGRCPAALVLDPIVSGCRL